MSFSNEQIVAIVDAIDYNDEPALLRLSRDPLTKSLIAKLTAYKDKGNRFSFISTPLRDILLQEVYFRYCNHEHYRSRQSFEAASPRHLNKAARYVINEIDTIMASFVPSINESGDEEMRLMHFQRGKQLGITDLWTDQTLTESEWCGSSQTDDLLFVAKILKNTPPVIRKTSQYRFVHVDLGFGLVKMRVDRNTDLYRDAGSTSEFKVGKLVLLDAVRTRYINGQLALDFNQASIIERFDEVVEPTWEEVLQWYAWKEEERARLYTR